MENRPAAGVCVDTEDRALLLRCAAGDQLALRDLLERYQPRLWGYLWHQLDGDRERVEDVLQEVFLAVWQHAGSFRGEAQVATWLFRLAHHRAANARRSASRHADDNAIAWSQQAMDSLGVASSEAETVHRLDLAAAIRSLAPKLREVIALLFVQGFTQIEVAAILDVPLGTVKSRLAQARQALRVSLSLPEEVDHV